MTALRILVVEDDALVAMTVEDLLEDLGCVVVGSVASVAEATGWLEGGTAFDAALLDLSLRDGLVFPVADILAQRGVPFAFTTGYGEVPGGHHPDAPKLGKPIRREALEAVLRAFGSVEP
ncbi:MAG: response regulator [Caulobacterales bacterium]